MWRMQVVTGEEDVVCKAMPDSGCAAWQNMPGTGQTGFKE
jgi:hypothetical protein